MLKKKHAILIISLYLIIGKAKTKVSYLHDGALVVEYPFHMAITMETNPHPLLSTEHQLHVKRKVILPDNVVHRLEWRYYLRKDGSAGNARRTGGKVDKVGRRVRVGTPRHDGRAPPDLHELTSAEGGFEGKALMVRLLHTPTNRAHAWLVFSNNYYFGLEGIQWKLLSTSHVRYKKLDRLPSVKCMLY